MSVLRDERYRYRQALCNVVRLLDSLPSGIDTGASVDDESPEDMTAHIGGLIWQECQKALRDE